MADLHQYIQLSPLPDQAVLDIIETLPLSKKAIVIEFLGVTSKEEKVMVGLLRTFMKDNGLSSFFPYPVYLVSQNGLIFEDFPSLKKYSALPEFYKLEVDKSDKALEKKSQLIKKQYKNIPISNNIKGLRRRAETIRFLKECDEQLSFYSQVKDNL